jgi:hypothetical protein
VHTFQLAGISLEHAGHLFIPSPSSAIPTRPFDNLVSVSQHKRFSSGRFCVDGKYAFSLQKTTYFSN